MALGSLGQPQLNNLVLSGNRISKVVVSNQEYVFDRPLVTFEIDQKEFASDSTSPMAITFNCYGKKS
jgi:hypothetical protein